MGRPTNQACLDRRDGPAHRGFSVGPTCLGHRVRPVRLGHWVDPIHLGCRAHFQIYHESKLN